MYTAKMTNIIELKRYNRQYREAKERERYS